VRVLDNLSTGRRSNLDEVGTDAELIVGDSGRYCHAFAARGARRVLGIDFAPAMIEIATTSCSPA